MNCWCGGILNDSFHKEYYRCSECGTFVSKNKTPKDFYDFKNFWYKRQDEVKEMKNSDIKAYSSYKKLIATTIIQLLIGGIIGALVNSHIRS